MQIKHIKYGCCNEAWHDYLCCPTCWNGHPEATKGEMFLRSKKWSTIIRNEYIIQARAHGFTKKQAEFLYDN